MPGAGVGEGTGVTRGVGAEAGVPVGTGEGVPVGWGVGVAFCSSTMRYRHCRVALSARPLTLRLLARWKAFTAFSVPSRN